MKKLSLIFLMVLMVFGLFACETGETLPTDPTDPTVPTEPTEPNDTTPPINNTLYRTNVRENVEEIVLLEHERGFLFFWELANTNESSPGYGLIPDRFNTFTDTKGGISSIASVGFGLTAIPVGIESGYITREAGEDRAYRTLMTFQNMQRTHGFWYHFVDMNTGLRAWNSEVSIIDSAIFINGALVAGRYFGGRVEELAYELYESIEWNWYFDAEQNMFYMGYRPETGFEGYWDQYGEQLMLYILAAGSPDYPVGKGAYTLMKLLSSRASSTEDYGSFYMTWTGSLFTYQYSHAWFNFRDVIDQQGHSWFVNSQNAVDAAIAFAKTQTNTYIGIHENSWGMSATDGPSGYVGPYGSGPSAGNAHVVDGTVPAYGAVGSIVFRPEEAIAAMENYYTYERFFSKYGFKGAYNLSHSTNGWFASDIIGIDKGISFLMIENYLSEMIWNIYMEVPYIEDAIVALDFQDLTS